MINEKKINSLIGKYFLDEADDIPGGTMGGSQTAPPMGGGIPDLGGPSGGLGSGQQTNGNTGSDTPPGDPVGAAKFSKLFASITAPNGGFLSTVIGKYQTKYADITNQINNKSKQLQSLKGEIDILLSELTKRVAKDNSNQATSDNNED